jgi:SAM-dependent methyltransferase
LALKGLTVVGDDGSQHEKRDTRALYDSINEQLDEWRLGRHAVFMNYGYIGGPDEDAPRAGQRLFNDSSMRLILEVIGDAEMADMVVLDVGCGRGGNASAMERTSTPQAIVGADLSFRAVSFCARRYGSDRMRFLQADAELVPFRDGAFDIVTNIESSHSYPNIDRFYEGVARVLRPGGWFLYADVFDVSALDRTVGRLEGAGLHLEYQRDITANVLRSRDQDGDRQLRAFGDRGDREALAEVVAAPGSQVHEYMASGRGSYRILRLRKAVA